MEGEACLRLIPISPHEGGSGGDENRGAGAPVLSRDCLLSSDGALHDGRWDLRLPPAAQTFQALVCTGRGRREEGSHRSKTAVMSCRPIGFGT